MTSQSNEMLLDRIAFLEQSLAQLTRDLSSYQTIFDQSPTMIWLKDDKNNFLKANKLACRFTNVSAEDIVNRSAWDLYPDEADAYYQDDLQVIQSGQPKLGIIEQLQTPNGKMWMQTDKVPWRDSFGNIRGVVVFVSDITIRRKYEEEIFKSQKLRSLGVLAGGLAHDLNNLLVGIIGNIELASQSAGRQDECLNYLSRVKIVLDKARHLTQQLLTFAQGGAPYKKTVNLRELVGECVDLFSAGSNVECEMHADQDLRAVEIDATQICQVINNIIVNAQQAMPEGGKVVFRLSNARPEEIGNELKKKKSEYVKISIRDFGPGIPSDIAESIFDPFFTTKENGTGLGLAISHSIIKRHGGSIEVRSQPGEGAAFDILLPASFGEPETRQVRTSCPSDLKARVLVMDDEQFILDLMDAMLRRIGCEVTTCRNGEQAINEFRQAIDTGKPFDITILDLTVHGGLGGKETNRQLQEISRDYKSVVSSGYSNDPIISSPGEYGFCAVLKKPFGFDELKDTLTGLLTNSR